MKKICLIIFSTLMILVFSGCEKTQKLSCTQKTTGVNVSFNVSFNGDGNVMKGIDYKYDLDLSTLEKEQIDSIKKQDFCTVIKESMSDYKAAFAECNNNISNNHLVVSAMIDVNKISKEALNKMTSIDDAKASLQAEGYTCTIEK